MARSLGILLLYVIKGGMTSCSVKTCTELRWGRYDVHGDYFDMWPSSDPEICGESDLNLGGCSGALTQTDANSFCVDAGARLCTVSELQAYEAHGTGCGYDDEYTWSSTSCGGSMFYATKVSATNTIAQCQSASISVGVYARCCADLYHCTNKPSLRPTFEPSTVPSSRPSLYPTSEPTSKPSLRPTDIPSSSPSPAPSIEPSFEPTVSQRPTTWEPSSTPSHIPSIIPTQIPTASPTSKPSLSPIPIPTFSPSKQPLVRIFNLYKMCAPSFSFYSSINFYIRLLIGKMRFYTSIFMPEWLFEILSVL